MCRSLVLLLVLAIGLLPGRQAQAFTYVIDMAGAPLTTFTTSPGLSTTSGDVFHTFFSPAPAFEYQSSSVVSFGLLSTSPAASGNGQTGDFSGPADFYFKVGRGDGTGNYQTPASEFGPDVVHAIATLTGSVSISSTGSPSSTARFLGGSAEVVSGPNAGVMSFASTDPINGLAANELNLVYDGTPVQVWVDLISSVPAPTASALSISGFLRDEPTSVPEPGLSALVLSGLVTGILLRTFVKNVRARWNVF